MKFFDYLESSYASSNIETQATYSAFGHAETQAISDLTNGQRKFFKFVAYFKVIFNYFLVLFHIKPLPKSAAEIIKEMNDAKKAELEAKKAEAAKAALELVKDETVTS
jgi:hypothetical protein